MKQHILMYIQSYQQNIRSTEELEGHLAEEGVLLREYSGKGFMVIGDDTIFMIKKNSDIDFKFLELCQRHIQEISAAMNRPEHRITNGDPENPVPCTEVTIRTQNNATKFYVRSIPQDVAIALSNFRMESR